jgi:hypothetical protein
MDKIAARKHQHELRRAAKRKFVRIQKAYRGGKIGPYGSRSRHHQQCNLPQEAENTTVPPVVQSDLVQSVKAPMLADAGTADANSATHQ